VNKAQLAVVIVCLSVIWSCSNHKDLTQTATGDIPTWYDNPPSDNDHLYGVYTASSQDMQLSIDKASVGADQEIAKQLEVKVQGLQKKFEEEIGGGDSSELLQQFTQATRTVVDQNLMGVSIKERKTIQSGDTWRSYVLAEYPIGEANKALLEKLKSQTNLLTQIRSTQTFQELDSAVAKYDSTK